EITGSINDLLKSTNRLVQSPDLGASLASAHGALEQYRLLGEKLNSRIDPLAEGVTRSLAETDRTLVEVRGAAGDMRSMLRPDGPLRSDLDQALQQLAGTAESLTELIEFLKQHPNALITGRTTPPEKP